MPHFKIFVWSTPCPLLFSWGLEENLPLDRKMKNLREKAAKDSVVPSSVLEKKVAKIRKAVFCCCDHDGGGDGHGGS